MKKTNLKKCPFCGDYPQILICDEEGNVHDKEYVNDPYSGLMFALTHTNHNCPISVEEYEILGSVIYESLDELEACWNKRI